MERGGPQDACRGLDRKGREVAGEAWTLGYRPGALTEDEFTAKKKQILGQ